MSLRPLLTGILFSAAAFFPVEGLAAENNDAPQASGTQESTAAPISTQPPKLALPGFGTPASDDTSTQTDAAIAPITPVTGEAPQPTSRDVLAETAMAYGTFQQDVTDFNRELTSSDEIEAAATVLGTHNPERLSAGWLAYSALLASESEEFAREVRKTDAHYGRDRMMQASGSPRPVERAGCSPQRSTAIDAAVGQVAAGGGPFASLASADAACVIASRKAPGERPVQRRNAR